MTDDEQRTAHLAFRWSTAERNGPEGMRATLDAVVLAEKHWGPGRYAETIADSTIEPYVRLRCYRSLGESNDA